MKIIIEGKTGEGKTLVANIIKEYFHTTHFQGPLKRVHISDMYSRENKSTPIDWRADHDVLIVIKTKH